LTVAASLTYDFYRERLVAMREEQGRTLVTIADIKAEEIASWRRERLADVRVMSTNLELGRFVQSLADGRSAPVRTEPPGWVEQMRSQYDYAAVRLFDASGKLRLSSQPASPALLQDVSASASAAIRQRTALFEDFHGNGNEPVHLAVYAPLFGDGNNPVGAIEFQIDPHRFLYSHLQRWPTASKSAEALLVRREGADLVYLNELRHRKNTALKLKLSLATAGLPAAQAILGREGVVEGKDYRDVPVIAAVRRVPDSPWFLVVK
jgi:hypothetical protein